MLDLLGAMSLTAIAIGLAGTLVFAATRDPRRRRALVLLAAAWFVAVAGLAAAGVFSTPPRGTLAVGAALGVPLVAAAVAAARRPSVRAIALGVPLPLLVGVHLGRLLGAFFVALHAAGRLPPSFALGAGWGDVAVAATALPLALAIRRRASGWRGLTLLWNSVATLDLGMAVTLGVGSAAGSPWRFVFETPDSGALSTLPWVMVPAFLVPIYLLTHAAVFAQLARSAAAREDRVRLEPAA
jgi:hypothetical protein